MSFYEKVSGKSHRITLNQKSFSGNEAEFKSFPGTCSHRKGLKKWSKLAVTCKGGWKLQMFPKQVSYLTDWLLARISNTMLHGSDVSTFSCLFPDPRWE